MSQVSSEEEEETSRGDIPIRVSVPEDPHPNDPVTVGVLTETLTRVLTSQTQVLTSQLNPMKEQLQHLVAASQHLVAASPHAAMTIDKRNKVVVGTQGAHREEMTQAILRGGIATWTYMRIQGTDTTQDICLAVSCEHCALAYKIIDHDMGKRFRFVSLPMELMQCGILWVGLSHEHKSGPSPPKRSIGSDMTIVVLRDFPNHIRREDVPIWPSPWASTDFPSEWVASRWSTSGWSTTGTVHGSHCARHSDYIVFVESSGEPGHSGTLMYLLIPGKNTTIPLGIYHGVRPRERGSHPHLKFRGIIVPFPNRLSDKFQQHELTPSRDAPQRLRIKTGPKFLDRAVFVKSGVAGGNLFYEIASSDGYQQYGVLVGARGGVVPGHQGLA